MSFKLIAQSVWDNPGNRDKRIRKSLAAVAWQLQKHLLGTTRQLTLPNGVRFKAYPDCVVSSALVYSDWPEYHELMFARSILRPGDVVLDVGANVGHIALLLADVVGPEKVFAFEPAPAAYERLRENWHLNDWPADRLFQVALGADAGSVYLEDAGCPKTTVAVSEEGGGGRPSRCRSPRWTATATAGRTGPSGFSRSTWRATKRRYFAGVTPSFAGTGPG